MPILSSKTTETEDQRAARRLFEKQAGPILAKLHILSKDHDGAFLKGRIDSYGLSMDMVEKELPDVFAKVKAHMDSAAKKEAKAEEAPEKPKRGRPAMKKEASEDESPKEETATNPED